MDETYRTADYMLLSDEYEAYAREAQEQQDYSAAEDYMYTANHCYMEYLGALVG